MEFFLPKYMIYFLFDCVRIEYIKSLYRMITPHVHDTGGVLVRVWE